VQFEDADVLVMTPERLDLCTREWKKHLSWMAKVDLVVVDELHTLGEGRRGARLEGAISRFTRLNPLARLLGMSATLGNREELARWLGGIAVHSDSRPVPIEWRVVRFKKVPEKIAVAVDLVRACVADGGASLVFCQSRNRTEEVSKAMQEAGLRADFHHAGRSRSDRAKVETLIRQKSLDCVVSTSTLGVGVNLPVRQVLLYDIQRWTGRGYESLSTNELWQRAGRAGRPGLDSHGEVVVVAHHRDADAAKVLEGKFEAIRSALTDRRLLAEQMVVECGCGLAHTKRHLERVVAGGLSGSAGRRLDVSGVVESMVQAGMLRVLPSEEGDDKLRATRLGRVAVRQMVCPETVLLARKLAKRSMNWRLVDVLVLAAATEDMGARLLGDMAEGYEVELDLIRAGSVIAGGGSAEAGSQLQVTEKDWLGIVRTAMVMKWACEFGTDEASERGACSDAEVDAMCDQAQRVVQAIGAVMQVIQEDEALSVEEREAAKRLAALSRLGSAALRSRLWGEQAAVAMLDGVGHVMAGRLVRAGLLGLEEICQAEQCTLLGIDGVGAVRAKDWQAQAAALMNDQWMQEVLEEGMNIALEVAHASPGRYVVKRAEELRVEGKAAEDVVLVVGGGDLREVHRKNGAWSCGCVRSGVAGRCKHLVAIDVWESAPVAEGMCDAAGE
jgi:helicase